MRQNLFWRLPTSIVEPPSQCALMSHGLDTDDTNESSQTFVLDSHPGFALRFLVNLLAVFLSSNRIVS